MLEGQARALSAREII